MNSLSETSSRSTVRNYLIVFIAAVILLCLGLQITYAATFTPVARWNGTQFHAMNATGAYNLQNVDDPVIDIVFSAPSDVVAWSDGSSYYSYVVDAGNDRVQIFTTDIAYYKDATSNGTGTLAWNGGGAAAGGDFDDNTIMLNNGGVVRGSEELVVGEQIWVRVDNLGGYSYPDQVYTIVYEGAAATGGVFTLPDNSLSTNSVVTVKYAYSATVATNLLGDIDYTVAVAAVNGATIGNPIELNETIPNNDSPAMTIDVLSGIAYNQNTGGADEADIYVLDAGSAGPVNAALYAFHIEDDAAVEFDHQDTYDGPLNLPQDVAFSQSGTNTLAVPTVVNWSGTVTQAPAAAPTVTVLNNAFVQNHDYTINIIGTPIAAQPDEDLDGAYFQVIDNTLGDQSIKIVPCGTTTPAGAFNFDQLIPGMRFTITTDAAMDFTDKGTGAKVNDNTSATNNDYIFIADSGNDRIKIIKGADNGATATNGTSTTYFEDDSDIRDDYGVVTAQTPNQRFVSSVRCMESDMSVSTYDNSAAGTQAWTAVANFSGSGPTDNHYVYNYDTQVLTFGDGTFGEEPDVNDTIYAEYKPSLDVLDYGTTGTSTGNFSNPSGITARWNAARAWYDVYVSDTGNNRIVKLKFSAATETVTWVTSWTTGIAGDALSGPTDLVVMSDGQAAALDTVLLFVCDTGNDRVIVYRDEAAENEGTTDDSDSTFVTAFGGDGTNLGQFKSPSGISVVLNGTNFDVYVTDADATQSYVTKFQNGDDPNIDVDFSNILSTAYPTSANFIFKKQDDNAYLTTNASSSMYIQFFYSDTTAVDQASANLCSSDSFAVTTKQFSWIFADTPGSPALDDYYYVYARLYDQYGQMLKEDKSIQLLHIDASATNGIGTFDAWDGDSYFYVQNGSTRFLNLSVIFPDSVSSVSFTGDYPSTVIDTILSISEGTAWNSLQKQGVLFSEGHTDSTFVVSSSVLGSNTGLVSGPPTFDIANIKAQIKSDVVSTGTRVVTDSIVITAGSWTDYNGVSLTAPTLNKLYIRVAYLADISSSGDDRSTVPNFVANPDGVIDIQDVTTFNKAWVGSDGIVDPVADLAPYEGTVPDVWSMPDGNVDVLDLMIFTTMQDWYNAQNFAASIPMPEPVNKEDNTTTDDGENKSEYLEVITNRIDNRMTVEYYANDITNLMVAELIMLFNKDDYELISFIEGDFLNNGIFRGYEKDNGVHAYISSLDRENPGVSGSGKLLAIEVEVLGDAEDEYVIGFDLRNTLGQIIESGSLSAGSYLPNEPPLEYALYAAYPNPFNSSTRVMFDIARAGQTKIDIFNIRGQRVLNLVDDTLNAGKHSTIWDARQSPTGTYIVRLVASENTFTQKVILVK